MNMQTLGPSERPWPQRAPDLTPLAAVLARGVRRLKDSGRLSTAPPASDVAATPSPTVDLPN